MLFRGALFLRDELPIRLAHRVVELDDLPYELSQMPSIRKVRQRYIDSFQEITQFAIPPFLQAHVNGNTEKKLFPEHKADVFHDIRKTEDAPSSKADDLPPDLLVEKLTNDFADLLKSVKTRHDNVVQTVGTGGLSSLHLARGILEWKAANQGRQIGHEIQVFLDRFFMSRIGIRVLLGQFIALNEPPTDGYIGIIDPRTDVLRIAEQSAAEAQGLCEAYYSDAIQSAPRVRFFAPKKDFTFTYIPNHLSHMLFELLKNSLRATVEHRACRGPFPDIRVVVAEGREDITIKISDEGGGIPRSAMPLIWTYMYSTAKTPLPSQDDDAEVQFDYRPPLAGYGYGLPLCRLYARYFGGDLKLISMEGYGTDAYLHLRRLSDSEEPLYA